MSTFIIHYTIYILSLLLLLLSLFSLYDHPLIRGILLGIFCVSCCRCNYTGLVCRLYDEEESLMNPLPIAPDEEEIEIVELNRV